MRRAKFGRKKGLREHELHVDVNEELRLRASKITAKIIAEENRQSRVCSKLRAHVASTKPPVRIPILKGFERMFLLMLCGRSDLLYPLHFLVKDGTSRVMP